MVAVAFSDLHLGITTLNHRMMDMLNNMFIQIIDEIHPNVVICLGDVFNTKKPAPDVMEFATGWFSAWARGVDYVLVVPGNHDIDGFSGTSAVDFLDDMGYDNIMVFKQPTEYMGMYFLPYQRTLTPEIREMIRCHEQVFLHQGYTEAPMYGSRLYGNKTDAVEPSELYRKKLALFGHIHNPLYLPEKNIYVLGAPYQIRYVDPMQERGFACWDMEDPSDLQIIPFNSNFYLAKLEYTVESEEVKNPETILEMLPSPAPNYSYQVQVTVEGTLLPRQANALRAAIREVYRDTLDTLSVTTVLPKHQRTFYNELKLASRLQGAKGPEEMLATYMKGNHNAYFDANPDIQQTLMAEFADIVQSVNENGKDG